MTDEVPRRRRRRMPPPDPPSRPQAETTGEWLVRLARTAPLADVDRAALGRDVALLSQTAPEVETKPTVDRVVVVRDLPGLDRIAQDMDAADVVAVDVETSSLDPRTGEIVGLGVAFGETVAYVPCAHRDPDSGELLADQLAVRTVMNRLRLTQRKLVAHNAKFELRYLRHQAGVECSFAWDTMLAAKLLAPHLPADLKVVAMRELDVPDWGLSREELATIATLPVERVARHCGDDCRHTLALYRRQHACLS